MNFFNSRFVETRFIIIDIGYDSLQMNVQR